MEPPRARAKGEAEMTPDLTPAALSAMTDAEIDERVLAIAGWRRGENDSLVSPDGRVYWQSSAPTNFCYSFDAIIPAVRAWGKEKYRRFNAYAYTLQDLYPYGAPWLDPTEFALFAATPRELCHALILEAERERAGD
jgi:hypothetical protein